MQLFHSSSRLSATFDDANLVAAAGLVPAMALAVRTGLGGSSRLVVNRVRGLA